MAIYTKNQINDLVDDILNNLTKDEFHYSALTDEEQDDLVNMICSKNRTEKSIKQFISAYIQGHAFYIDEYSDSMQNNLIRKAAINRYTHNLNLKYIKSEIYYKYDVKEGKNIMFRWHSNDGMFMDTIVDELAEMGIYISSINEADQFFEFMGYLEDYKPTKVNDTFAKEEIDLITNMSFDKIINKKITTKHNLIQEKNEFIKDIKRIEHEDDIF